MWWLSVQRLEIVACSCLCRGERKRHKERERERERGRAREKERRRGSLGKRKRANEKEGFAEESGAKVSLDLAVKRRENGKNRGLELGDERERRLPLSPLMTWPVWPSLLFIYLFFLKRFPFLQFCLQIL